MTAIELGTWSEVDEGFWAGNAQGVFLGTIERTGAETFLAQDHVGGRLGEFSSSSAARAAITDPVR
ncbi:hypothetical protein [Agromyces seonyuensis]|uniref:Uncharacterized protein n=1 Tax=Agromyces seonyuensis TaxID=2662446 RepID=A0A6I4NZ91_9MICO|nr:hypothetical protein [Agromyces seonyuensis]MWB98532.1 hypothetical protein [Agromyces seonyuensis]